MKKILTFITLFFSLFFWGQAINSTAKKILDATSKELSKSQTFYLKFHYLYNVPGQKSTAEIGEVYASGEKYHLILPTISQIFDGKKLYTIHKEDLEVTISENDESANLSPTNILNIYKKGFNISYEGIKIASGIKCETIKLIPVQKTNSASIVLSINKNKIIRLVEHYKNGSSLSLTVKDFQENLVINKSFLTFNKDNYKEYTFTEL